MAIDLSKVGTREALKARREPYWHRLRVGCHLGYRPSKRGGPGKWIARAYDDENREYVFRALGDYGALTGAERFGAAKRDAEAYAQQVEAGGVVEAKMETVSDACKAYAETRPDAVGRFKRYVYDDPLGKVKLEKLRKKNLAAWRKRLEEQPALVSRNKGGEKQTRPRAPATINRDIATLRAALNTVLAHGTPKTESAWQEALLSIPNADGQRILYLDKVQRKQLLDNIDDEGRAFTTALCLLPIRPGAMAALTVADFDKRTSELTIRKDKTPKVRRVEISQAAATLFTAQSKDKLPNALLFMRSNGKAWDKETWNRPIMAASKAGKLPKDTTAYTLRHSVITDLVNANVPLLTIAQIAGTSVAMIELHYGHLVSNAAVEGLNELAL